MSCCNGNCRQGRDCPQRPNLLASRCVWIGGALSVAIWAALVWIFWGHA